jgi:hypothetical protein
MLSSSKDDISGVGDSLNLAAGQVLVCPLQFSHMGVSHACSIRSNAAAPVGWQIQRIVEHPSNFCARLMRLGVHVDLMPSGRPALD